MNLYQELKINKQEKIKYKNRINILKYNHKRFILFLQDTNFGLIKK